MQTSSVNIPLQSAVHHQGDSINDRLFKRGYTVAQWTLLCTATFVIDCCKGSCKRKVTLQNTGPVCVWQTLYCIKLGVQINVARSYWSVTDVMMFRFYVYYFVYFVFFCYYHWCFWHVCTYGDLHAFLSLHHAKYHNVCYSQTLFTWTPYPSVTSHIIVRVFFHWL